MLPKSSTHTASLYISVEDETLTNWRREEKIWLIQRENPTWEDLAAGWLYPQAQLLRDSE
jgi:hypothetical protein